MHPSASAIRTNTRTDGTVRPLSISHRCVGDTPACRATLTAVRPSASRRKRTFAPNITRTHPLSLLLYGTGVTLARAHYAHDLTPGHDISSWLRKATFYDVIVLSFPLRGVVY